LFGSGDAKAYNLTLQI